MITLDDYLADQLHDPDFRTHFINEMAFVTALFPSQMPLNRLRLIFHWQSSKSFLNSLFELATPPTKCYTY